MVDAMAECAYCKADTELHVHGVPVCFICSDARTGEQQPPASEHKILNTLQQEYKAAAERGRAAIQAFDAVTSQIPSRIPHPDGTQRINNASREVSLARAELMRAHYRLVDFMTR